MKARLLILAAIYGFAMPLCAQQRPESIITIKAIKKGDTAAGHSLITASPMCDDGNNIYSRPFDIDRNSGVEEFQAAIQKTTPDAAFAGTIPLNALPGGTRTFFIRDGRVYAPSVSEKGELYIAELAPDGSLRSKVKLEMNKWPDIWHLAVFNSGEYFVVGTARNVGAESHIPFAAVFGADGHLVKQIYEPEDEDARQKAEGGGQAACCNDYGNLFVMFDADVTVGSDNNAYLLHGTSPTLIYAISPSGEVVRKLKFSGGDANLKATSIKSYGGRLAIGFSRVGKVPQNMVKVIDFDGNPIASYEVQEPVGDSDTILACYGHNGFTLIPRLGGAKPYLFIAKLP